MVESHQTPRRHEEIKGGSNRAFGLVFTAFFTLLGLWPLHVSEGIRLWALIPAGVFLLVSLTAPKLLAPLNRLWTKLGLLMARFVSPVAMAIVYFLAVAPTGLLMRIFGKDLLKLKYDASADTYWEMRNPPGPAPESIENQF